MMHEHVSYSYKIKKSKGLAPSALEQHIYLVVTSASNTLAPPLPNNRSANSLPAPVVSLNTIFSSATTALFDPLLVFMVASYLSPRLVNEIEATPVLESALSVQSILQPFSSFTTA